MKLLPRVMTLIRANLNDMLDKAEDPEKMIKQLIADLNNHLIQVKTAAAQSLADQHILQRRLDQAREEMASCERRAELAVRNQDDRLARTALERYNSYQRTASELEKQLEEQRKETEGLKLALHQIEVKVSEVTRQRDTLLARHRRATARERLSQSRPDIRTDRLEEILEAVEGYVEHAEARASAATELETVSETGSEYRKLARMEEEDALDRQLAQLKEKVSASGAVA